MASNTDAGREILESKDDSNEKEAVLEKETEHETLDIEAKSHTLHASWSSA